MRYFKKTGLWNLLTLASFAIVLASCELYIEEPVSAQSEVQGRDIQEQLIPGQYIVVLHEKDLSFRKTDKYEDVQAAMRVLSTEIVARHGVSEEKIKSVFGNLLVGFVVEISEQQLASLREEPEVNYIEQDRVAYAFQTEQSSAVWGIDRIDQRNLPLSGTYVYNNTGEGVSAYIFDTGIRYDHVEFEGRAILGKDYYNGNGSDVHGHGTHVAGTVGGKLYGVAKKVTLVSVKVLSDNGSGSFSNIINGLDWVRANKSGPSVVNMSLGASGTSTTLNTAVKNLFNAGVPVIVAAGNSSDDASKFTPANAPDAFAVGATTSTDARASFSNFGTTVKLFAPGSGIRSAVPTSNISTALYSGTSMASPHVAGAAALMMAVNPSATSKQIYDLLIATATPDKVSNPGVGSPNLLLYALNDNSNSSDPTENPVTPEEPVVSDPKINFFSTAESSNKTFIRSIATWKVGDAGGKLQSVRLELLNKGVTVSTLNIQVNGTIAEGQNELSVKGSADQVRITVTADGKTISRTQGLTQADTGSENPVEDPKDDNPPPPVDEDPGNDIPSVPVISRFDITSSKSGQWNRGVANWTVSDEAVKLQSVTIQLLGTNGAVLESSVTTVSGSSASGTGDLRSRNAITGMKIIVQAGGVTKEEIKNF
jgi:subtilisin family serine protease